MGRLRLSIVLVAALFLVLPVRAALAATAFSVRSDVDDQLYLIDLSNGTATAIGPTGFGDVEGLAFDSSGTLYGVDEDTDQLVTISPTTGAATVVGPLGVTGHDVGLAFDCTGALYMSTEDPGNLYRVNHTTGAATLVGAQGQPVTGLTADSSGVFGLGGGFTNNLVRLDTSTGAATPVGPLGIAVDDGGIEFDAAGVLWGLEDTGTIFTVDPATGAATAGATTLAGFESLAIDAPRCGPTAVLLSSLEALRGNRGVLVGWRTGSDSGLLGFHVYRELDGVRARVSRTLVRGRSTVAGRSYAFLDRTAPKGAPGLRYWLQAVTLDGSRRWYGPARVSAPR